MQSCTGDYLEHQTDKSPLLAYWLLETLLSCGNHQVLIDGCPQAVLLNLLVVQIQKRLRIHSPPEMMLKMGSEARHQVAGEMLKALH